MRPSTTFVIAVALLAPLFFCGSARADKIRELVDVAGVRENQLVGYGIVTGLNGTGDDTSVPFTAQSVTSLLRRLGVQVDPTQIRLKNVAAVIVTANLQPFARAGSKLDVSVASIGDAKSLSGGVLVQTLLRGSDSKTYAVAQGSVLTVAVKPGASSTLAPVTTSGRIPEGGIVERDVPTTFVNDGNVKLTLRSPSFTVAARMVAAVEKILGPGSAHADDGGIVIVKVSAEDAKKPVELLAKLEDIEVTAVRRARVVVSERTQTIVAGGDVRLAPAVVVHDGLTIVVKPPAPPAKAAPAAPPPNAAVPKAEAAEGDKPVHYLAPAATLGDVASALSALGLSSRELASVLEALRTAGVLEAEVVVQ